MEDEEHIDKSRARSYEEQIHAHFLPLDPALSKSSHPLPFRYLSQFIHVARFRLSEIFCLPHLPLAKNDCLFFLLKRRMTMRQKREGGVGGRRRGEPFCFDLDLDSDRTRQKS